MAVTFTTYDFDQNVQLPLHAASIFPVYWIVNLIEKSKEVYVEPNENHFQKRKLCFTEDSVPILKASLPVAELWVEII